MPPNLPYDVGRWLWNNVMLHVIPNVHMQIFSFPAITEAETLANYPSQRGAIGDGRIKLGISGKLEVKRIFLFIPLLTMHKCTLKYFAWNKIGIRYAPRGVRF